MSEHAPPCAVGETAVDSPPGLTPEAIEAILQEFRAWLEQAADRAAVGEPAPAAEPEFSWPALAAEFTALRQEVNLQTRAARSQLEQNAQTLQQLGEAVGALQERSEDDEDKGQNDDAEVLRPLLKTLVDAYDALSLARREVQRAQRTMDDLLTRVTSPPEPHVDQSPGDRAHPAAPGKRRWWQWWLTLPTDTQAAKRMVRVLDQWCESAEAQAGSAASPRKLAELETRLVQQDKELTALRHAETVRGQAADQARQVLSSILVGYTMSLQRIERALAQFALEPIDCVGEAFDPECMEVVEVVAEPGRQSTEVLEEVRRGYRWRGRLFRFAQVRVARP